MRYITNIFLKGLGAVLPIDLTFYLLYWLGSSFEQILRSVIQFILPNRYYWPGMGLVAALVLHFVIGIIVEAWIVQRLFGLGDRILERIPLVKLVYGALRDFISYFSKLRKEEKLQNVVSVKLGERRLLGFLTLEEMGPLIPGDTLLAELVAV